MAPDEILAELGEAQEEELPRVGGEYNLSLRTPHREGALTSYQERVIHLMVFASPEPVPERERVLFG